MMRIMWRKPRRKNIAGVAARDSLQRSKWYSSPTISLHLRSFELHRNNRDWEINHWKISMFFYPYAKNGEYGKVKNTNIEHHWSLQTMKIFLQIFSGIYFCNLFSRSFLRQPSPNMKSNFLISHPVFKCVILSLADL